MNRIKTTLRILLAVVAALQLTACSKTVQWEEEVPLNTGETIWVKRTDTFVKGSEPGNPLKMTWGLDKRVYEFSWQEQKYTYQAQARVFHGPILIYAFSSDKTIAIVDSARDCEKLGQGEFRWRNGSWQLQQNLNRTLIDQPRNLMGYFSNEGDIPARVDKEFKQRADSAPNRAKPNMRLDETHVAINCSRSK